MRGKGVYSDYIDDILNAIASIKNFVEGVDFDHFLSDEKTNYAVIRALEIIGEASSKIPPEVREKYSDIPWKEIIGMRNKLIHEYAGVDLKVVWDTIEKDIFLVKEKIEKMKQNF